MARGKMRRAKSAQAQMLHQPMRLLPGPQNATADPTLCSASQGYEPYRRSWFFPSARERPFGRGNLAALPGIDRDSRSQRPRETLEGRLGDMMAIVAI